ncbi:MAG: hypothetical protein GY847_33035 [Proteobacteria bacterium]|nr:hypothetical protein [Pseudomonadota bacterium]
MRKKLSHELVFPGKRVGRTVLVLSRMTEIVYPGPARRSVFIDNKDQYVFNFRIEYLRPTYTRSSIPPTNHSKGCTISMADGHAEYWKWKGTETVESILQNPEPETEEGIHDLQRLQKIIWDRLGYEKSTKSVN